MIPGLEKAEFERYGVMHRNTFINSPALLDNVYRLKKQPNLFFAGQMTGVEGMWNPQLRVCGGNKCRKAIKRGKKILFFLAALPLAH